jgi:hypothetical protein
MRIVLAAACLLVLAHATSQGPPAVTLSPNAPADLSAQPTQADAVTFAWQWFAAVNWPALPNARGVPDASRRIGQPGTVVWHTWKQPEEVFLPDGAAPPDWNTYPGVSPSICTGTAGTGPQTGDLILSRTSKVAADANGNNALELSTEVIGGSLTDQHGNLARYEVRFNKTEFDTIVQNRFYNVEGQDAARVIQMPAGVMEAKASWRIIGDTEPAAVQARFVRRGAWIYTPPAGPQPATCVKATVGLTGLHITRKTATRPQWIWATFEHVDNVPPTGPNPPKRTLPYSFNNPLCSVSQCQPNQSVEDGRPASTPTQVTRVVNIGAAAAQANQAWQAALAKSVTGSPFQFYQLVDVQWPQTPSQRPVGNPTPGLLANTTMETYVEDSSCIQCHYTARTKSGRLSSDFTFVLAHAQPSKASR